MIVVVNLALLFLVLNTNIRSFEIFEQLFVEIIVPEDNRCAHLPDYDPDTTYDKNCKAVIYDAHGYSIGTYEWFSTYDDEEWGYFENVNASGRATLNGDVYPEICSNYDCGSPPTFDEETGHSQWPFIAEVALAFDGHPNHNMITTLIPGYKLITSGAFYTLPSINRTAKTIIHLGKTKVGQGFLFIGANPWPLAYDKDGNAYFPKAQPTFRGYAAITGGKFKPARPICMPVKFATSEGRQLFIMEQIGDYALEIPVTIVGRTKCQQLYTKKFEDNRIQNLILNGDITALCVTPADGLPHTFRLGAPIATKHDGKYFLIGLVKFSFIHSSTIPNDERLPYVFMRTVGRVFYPEDKFPTKPWENC